MSYRPQVVDSILEDRLDSKGAVLIQRRQMYTAPQGCDTENGQQV